MKTALQFSGGKDSLALLYYVQSLWEFIDVIVIDAGDMYSATRARVELVSKLVPNFVYLKSDAPAYRKVHGDPNDANWLACCVANVYAPMHDYIKKHGYRQILRGTKAVDPHIHLAFPGDVMDGILMTFPLWHWSDLEVMEYLGERLPLEYRLGAIGMPDCRTCTAFGQCGGTTKHIWDAHEQATLDLH